MFRGETSKGLEIEDKRTDYMAFAYPLVKAAVGNEGLSPDFLNFYKFENNPYLNDFSELINKAITEVKDKSPQSHNSFSFKKIKVNGLIMGIDGINGSGKTTIIQELKNATVNNISRATEKDNLAYPYLRGRFEEDRIRLRDLSPIEESLLLGSELYYRMIFLSKPMLNLMDRSPLSFLAYQAFSVSKEYDYPISETIKFLTSIISGLPTPNKMIFLDINEDTIIKRTRIEEKQMAEFKELSSVFRLIAELLPSVYTVDANKNILEVKDEVASIIYG